jgi:hypothetical protein
VKKENIYNNGSSRTNENEIKNNEKEESKNNLNDNIDHRTNEMISNTTIKHETKSHEQKIITTSELSSDIHPTRHDDKNELNEIKREIDNEENESGFTKSTKLSLSQRDQNSYTPIAENDETFEKISETSFSKSLPTCFNQDADTRYSLEGADDDEQHPLPNETKFLELPEKHFSKSPNTVITQTENSESVKKNENNKNFKKHLKLLEKRFTLSAKNTYIRDRIENEASRLDDKTRYGSSIKDSKVNNSFINITQNPESSDEISTNDSEDMAVLGIY